MLEPLVSRSGCIWRTRLRSGTGWRTGRALTPPSLGGALPYDGTPLVTEGLGATKLLGDRKETTPASSLSMVTVGSPSFHFSTTDSFTTIVLSGALAIRQPVRLNGPTSLEYPSSILNNMVDLDHNEGGNVRSPVPDAYLKDEALG